MEVEISTSEATEFVDVTERVQSAIEGVAGTGTATATVYVPHTTAGVVVNEAEPRLLEDLEWALSELAPSDRGYRHDEIDDNAAAHIRAAVLGESVTVPVDDGRLALGTWQSILLVECDGPRQRRLHVTVTES